MRKILAIYGSGGFGREVHDIAVRVNTVSALWRELVFINDFEAEQAFLGTRIVHFDTLLADRTQYECTVGVGEPSTREALYKRAVEAGLPLATLVDPTALVSPSARIGEGSIVCEFATIHCGVTMGKNCLIQPYACIGHDILIGDHSVFSSHAAPGGSSCFGNRVYIGMHATLKEKLRVGDDVAVAMGAVVFRDVEAHALVAGNPARTTKRNEDGKIFTP